ncbi:MAG: polysaccharide deacetylase family protein [Deltaproteobacteria bacterium]|nr:polysaccharide deacetylase family protein [Deltaproteobacteria bacterium]
MMRRLLKAAASFAPRSVLVRRGPADRPSIALTFDDGPLDEIDAYLDALDRLAVRATFFLVGEECARRPSKVTEIVARGHEVAGHGFTHRPFPELSFGELRDELARTSALLPPSERARSLVRPPRGAVSPRSLSACALLGYTTVLFSLDSDDCRTRSVDEVVAKVGRARAGDIVLLHEGQGWTLEALPRVVADARAAGLALVTVGEMLA